MGCKRLRAPRATLAALALVSAAWLLTPSADAGTYGLGRPATAAEIAAWDIDVRPDGQGLPPGQGTVEQGAALFARSCAACHGAQGRGGPAGPLVGGIGTLASPHPVKTVGSYWPYATTLFDYIRRAMPYQHPKSLSASQVYALVAFILHANGIVPAATMLDAVSLPKVQMPNRHGFVGPTAVSGSGVQKRSAGH